MDFSFSRRAAGRRLVLPALLVLGLAVSGCQSVSRMTTGSVRPAVGAQTLDRMSPTQLETTARSYGAAYEKDPKNKGTGMGYAALLQRLGRNDQSLAVMQQVAIANSQDRDVLAAYGKALAAAGELPKALETVRRAQTPDYPDWRLLSAEGAILDQLGRLDEARVAYRKALEIQPNEASVLSNLGMSHVLGNDLKTAETYLRQAAGRPDADSRVHQNLALAVGLQGRFDEAERIASAELSPEDATANVSYLKRMLAQQNTWSMLRDKNEKRS